MSVYAIGDIQGCYLALRELLKHIAFNTDRDQLWFVGDLVNRGPDSLSSLRYIRDLGDNAITVLGNHDLHLLAIAHGNSKHNKTDPGMTAILEAKDREPLLDWLRHRPLIHHDPNLNFTVVHAGITPQWDLPTALTAGAELSKVLRSGDTRHYFEHMYGNQPDNWPDSHSAPLQGMQRHRYITNVFTRMRYLRNDGSMEHHCKQAPDEAPKALSPWFKADGPAQQQTRIVFGHWSTLGDYQGHNVWATDSGCLWGGKLTALELGDKPKRHSIPCQSARKPG